jgi:protocatechuate 3,4-dioxygenase beta subunit
MAREHRNAPSFSRRRRFLQACLTMPASLALAACVGQMTGDEDPPTATPAPAEPMAADPTATSLPAQAAPLSPTPTCPDDDEVTPPQTAGPFYTPDTPQRTSLVEPGMAGTPMVLNGHVLGRDCQPVGGALLDFWHCDDAGVYDNAGYRLRGHQFADETGRYHLETIVPGLYPGRTRHIHVRVQAPDQPVLTTQLYFPNEPGNAADGIFRPELVMDVQDTSEGKAATFDFVLQLG